MFVINPYRFATTSSALTSADFTTSNGDGGAINWTGTQAVATDPNTSKSVFAKSNTSYSSNIIYCQSNISKTARAAAGNMGGMYLSSSTFSTANQVHTTNYNAMMVGRGTANTDIRLRVNTTSNVYNTDDGGADFPQDYKITFNTSTNDIKFWYWNGSSWTQIGTTQTYDIKNGGSLYLYLCNVDVGDTDIFTFNNIYFGSAASDYSTHYP